MAEKAKVIKKKSASPVPKAQPEADLKALLTAKLLHNFSVQPESATNEHFYNALVLVLRDMMRARRVEYIGEAHRQQSKQVYYLCMEFLMGRSLKNTLYNLNLTEEARQVLDGFHVKLDALFELEPDAGLGNGGLGRLAACFLDGLATAAIPAVGYSLLYEYGIFRQKLVDGWQTELPDFWLPGGESWLLPRPELAKEVRFDGNIREWWDDNGFHHVVHDNANIVIAQPYDLMVAGKDGRGLRTGRATGRIKAGAGLAGNESFGHRPLYRLFCPSLHRATVLITVQVTAALDIPALILRKPEEHCRQLRTRHIFVRTEAAILEACNDPHLGSPADHAGIPFAVGTIRKLPAAVVSRGRACHPIEHGRHHRAAERRFWCKFICADAVHQSKLICSCNILKEPVAACHIAEAHTAAAVYDAEDQAQIH